MKDILLYSGNLGKIEEFQSIFSDSKIQLVTAVQIGIETGIEETGTTFIENAIIKARDGAKKSKMPCIADDSGLIVDCLDGAPGLYSSEYAGKNASSSKSISKLLKEMQPYSKKERTARFYCCLVYLRNATDPRPIIAEGICEGVITQHAQGANGFGYDPVFYRSDFEKTLAELEPEIKHGISHRGIAIKNLRLKLIEQGIIT